MTAEKKGKKKRKRGYISSKNDGDCIETYLRIIV